MLKDEFERLMKLFAEGAEGKPIPLDDVFRESLSFFSKLNTQLQKGDDEEKRQALMMMTEMYTQINQHIKKIAESSGMSEEQLSSYADNPGNFSSSEWMSIQEARNKMFQAGQSLAKSVEALNEATKKKHPELSDESPTEAKKKGHVKRPKRSDWNRS